MLKKITQSFYLTCTGLWVMFWRVVATFFNLIGWLDGVKTCLYIMTNAAIRYAKTDEKFAKDLEKSLNIKID